MTVNSLTIIESYISNGWRVIPVLPKSKKPIIDKWNDYVLGDDDVNKYWGNNKVYNIGVVLGDASGRLADIDLDCPEAILIAPQYLPPTRAKFGRESSPISHHLFTVDGPAPTYLKFTDPSLANKKGSTIIELRYGTKYQTVFPPSIHESGEEVKWYGITDIESEGIPPPAKVDGIALDLAVRKIALCVMLIRSWNEGQRQDIIMALSGWLLRHDWPIGEVRKLIHIVCAYTKDNELQSRLNAIDASHAKLEQKESVSGWPTLVKLLGKDIAESLAKYLNIEVGDTYAAKVSTEYNLTQSGNVDLFIKHFGNDYRYVEEWKRWIKWNGKYWEECGTTGSVFELDITKIWLQEAVRANTLESQRAILRWVDKCRDSATVKGALSLAEGRPELRIKQSALDSYEWLFNTQNGVVDLRTMELTPPTPSSYLTRISPASFIDTEDSITAPVFTKFMQTIFNNNEALIEFVLRAIGYSLSGVTDEHAFFILWGNGANGKSTLINLISSIMGPYATRAATSAIIRKKSDTNNSNDIAVLKEARFVSASETEEGQYLAESLIKDITGGELISARRLYGEFFTFRPSFKLWIGTNYKPNIRHQDGAMWRRVRLIPFIVTIPEDERIPPSKLQAMFLEEQDAILTIFIRAAHRYYTECTLTMPDEVRAATENYRSEMDSIGRFLEENYVLGVDYKMPYDELYIQYADTSESNHEVPMSKKRFTPLMESRGFHIEKGLIYGLREKLPKDE